MPKSPNDQGWLLQAGTKNNLQVSVCLPILYKYRFDLNQPAIPGRSLDPSDIANLADFQRVAGLVAGQGLDWPTMQALQYYDRISLHWANALPGGLRLDIAAMQWALARIGLMGDWSWWSGVGTHGPRTAEAVNRFYAENRSLIGVGDGKIGPEGFGLLAHKARTFTCTTPWQDAPVQPHVPAAVSSSRYVRPIRARRDTPITQGWDVYNPRYVSKEHNGVDIAAPYGEPIYATIGGVVLSYRSEGQYGNRIRVRGDDGKYWAYNHTSACTVRVGSRVKTGQQIGRVGNSGQVTGPHLCMECYGNAAMRYNTDQNPNLWP